MENLVYFENLVRGATTSSREQFGRNVFKKKKKKLGAKEKNYSRWVSTHILIHTNTKISFSHRYALVSSRSSMNVSKQTSFKRVIANQVKDFNNTRSRGDISSNRRRAHTRRALHLLSSFSQEIFSLFLDANKRGKHTKQKKKTSAIKTN